MSLCFSIPNFFTNYKTNHTFFGLIKQYPNYLKNQNIDILSSHGQFPYCYWNGGINVNSGPGAFYHDFIECGDFSNLPLRFNCSNTVLDDIDFNNVMANLILEHNGSGSNEIEVCNLKLFNYIKENYPMYSKFIFSKNGDLINPMTPEIINSLIASDNFALIELPTRYNGNFEELKKISKRSHIEIVVNPLCEIKCPNFENCRLLENSNQYNYSGSSVYCECSKRKSYDLNPNIITLEEIEEKYVPLGITHFKIEDFPRNEPMLNYYNFLINYFIKPEYQKQVLALLVSGE